MEIQSKKARLNRPAESVFAYLSNFENFTDLLPQNRVNVKESSPDHVIFEIEGMATIGMKVAETEAPNKIHVVSEGKNPFDFEMDIHIYQVDENNSEVFLNFKGEVNAFLKMMVEKPLTNFFNSLAEKLEEQDI